MSHARIRRLLLAIAGAIASVLIAGPAAALAGPGDFYSSFEDGEPAPTWTDTVDLDANGNERCAGVTGPTRDGLAGRRHRQGDRRPRERRELSGSNDGQTWTQLDSQTGQDFSERCQQKEYVSQKPLLTATRSTSRASTR